LLLGGIIAGLILFLGGWLGSDTIQPGRLEMDTAHIPEPTQVTQAQLRSITDWFEAVGTVRPKNETNIEAQVTGRVVEVLVASGATVKAGQELIVLDSREFASRLDQAGEGFKSAQARQSQAQQAVASARAGLDRAKAEHDRFQKLFESKTVSSREIERVRAEFLQAQAGLNQAQDALSEAVSGVEKARQQVEEAQISTGYTKITALDDAQVVQRLVDPGDLAWPGKPLLVLQTRQTLRLEALVREGLVERIRPGTKLEVYVDALKDKLEGTVDELVPSADPQTRTFLVRVAIPTVTGLFPGMFGRLRVPIEERLVVAAPAAAVRRVGQLEMVRAKTEAGWSDIFVRTGQTLADDQVEILSGLNGDEKLALWAGQ
jgi:RND family efflux transporter MFP subunit